MERRFVIADNGRGEWKGDFQSPLWNYVEAIKNRRSVGRKAPRHDRLYVEAIENRRSIGRKA